MAQYDNYLPQMFRRRKPAFSPEALNPALNNMLMQDPAAPAPAPLVYQAPQSPEAMIKAESVPLPNPNPNIAAAQSAPPPMPEMDLGGVDTMGRPPLIDTDKQGHPRFAHHATTEEDPLERAMEMQTAVAGYEPQKAKGWWDRFLKPALKGAGIGFMHGGLGGAIGGGAYGAIEGGFNPKAQDERWKRRKERETAGQVKIYEDQEQNRLKTIDQAAGIEQKRSSTDYNKARTRATNQGKWIIKQDENGVFVPVNESTGLDPKGNAVKGRQTASSDWELKTDEAGNYVPVNKKTGLDQNGNPVSAKSMVRMGDGWVDVTEKYKADTAAGQNTMNNRTVDENIAQIKAQIAKLDAVLNDEQKLPSQIDKPGPLGIGTERVQNPAYQQALEDRNRLDAELRDWKGKRKAKPPSTGPSGSKKDPLGLFQ